MIVTFNNCDQHLVIIHLLVMPIMVVMCAPAPALWWLLHCYKPWLGPVSSTFNSYITLIVNTNHHNCVNSNSVNICIIYTSGLSETSHLRTLASIAIWKMTTYRQPEYEALIQVKFWRWFFQGYNIDPIQEIRAQEERENAESLGCELRPGSAEVRVSTTMATPSTMLTDRELECITTVFRWVMSIILLLIEHLPLLIKYSCLTQRSFETGLRGATIYPSVRYYIDDFCRSKYCILSWAGSAPGHENAGFESIGAGSCGHTE